MYDSLKLKLHKELEEIESTKLTPYSVKMIYELSHALNEIEEACKGYAGKDCHRMRFLSEEDAKKWAEGLINDDGSTPYKGTVGAHWTREQTTQVAKQAGIVFTTILTPHTWYAIMNSIYSDYCETAKKHGVDNVAFFSDMAKNWLYDVDAVENKAFEYFTHIVK